MQTTFEMGPEEWTEEFWKHIMDSFGRKRLRVTLEEIDGGTPSDQYHVFLQLKSLQKNFPPFKVDENIDLSRLADESNDVAI